MSSGDNPQGPGESTAPLARRRLLQYGALAGGGLLAGCGGDGDGDGTSPGADTTTEGGLFDTETTADGTAESDGTTEAETTTTDITTHVDQEFRFPCYRDMGDLDYHAFPKYGNMVWDNITYEVGVYGKWAHPAYYGMGDLHLQQYADVVTEDDRLEITVREDANWSNGDPVTGRDAIAAVLHQRLTEAAKPFDAVESEGPSQAFEAVTDYTLDGKTAILHSDGGHFADILDQNIWRRILLEAGPRRNTRQEYFEAYTDRLFELMDRAVAGEVDPWSEGGTNTTALQEEVWGAIPSRNDEMQEYFRQPENIVTNGAWTVDEIRGQVELVFKPNKHHRHADSVNFEQIVLLMAEPANNIYTSLKTGLIDMAGRRMAPPQPHVRESFPDAYTRHPVRSDDGRGLELCHSQPYVEDLRVRQAMMAALDAVELCEYSRPGAFEPVQVPSGDCWALPDFLSDEWMDQNFQDYSYDTEFAAELMREGGYERDSNQQWVDGNGELVEVPLYTASGTPDVEQVIVSQLNDFGIQSRVQATENAILESERDAGNIPMWQGGANAGFAYTAIAGYTAGNASYKYAHWHENVMRRYAFFDGPVEQNIRQTPWNDIGWPTTQDPDKLEHLTVSAPPIGDFWAGRDDWEPRPVVSMAYRLDNAMGEEAEEIWRDLLWINNWHMPHLPWANTHSLYFVNTDNWVWPTDQFPWEYLNTSTNLTHESYLGWGDAVYANPDNPK